MTDVFDARLKIALELLAATGIRRSKYAPTLYGLLWAWGFRVPTPHFRS